MRSAILQVADQGPLESLVVMLRSVGYRCFLPDSRLRDMLKRLGCDTVLDIKSLSDAWGYDRPVSLPLASVRDMDTTDLYVDIKAHRNGPKVWGHWPNLKGRVLWYRINGGKPEHVVKPDGEDCGDEANPPCPILTPNLWYRLPRGATSVSQLRLTQGHLDALPACVQQDRAYACWPPFYRWSDYFDTYGRASSFDPPVCLIHNVYGWGYGLLAPLVQEIGIRIYGKGSPDGLISHSDVPRILHSAHCMVHLKSSDAPGYALYEALAAGCPLVVTRRLIWRNRMHELLIPNETCLVFDQPTHDALTEATARECLEEIQQALTQLSDPNENSRIGMAGYRRLKELMWNQSREQDVESLTQFMRRFP